MTKWICAAAAVLTLLGSAAPATAPGAPALKIHLNRIETFPNAHVWLGIAVLGHHVGHIECGYLFLPPARGFVHVDWTRCGNWDGLTAGSPSASDTTPSQMDATIQVIHNLGFAQDAIRSWMTVAPVGYDAYDTGAKTLRIGEILVDLGPMPDAAAALKKFSNEKGADPLDSVPANIAYADGLYVQPDCMTYEAQLRQQALRDAMMQAQILSGASAQRTTFRSISIKHSDHVLCPTGVQPQFKATEGYAAPNFDPQFICDMASVNVYFDVAPGGRPQIAAPTLPLNALAVFLPEDQPYPMPTSDAPQTQRYAETLGQSRVEADPDTLLIEAEYEIATPEWKLYPKSIDELGTAIQELSQLVPASDMLRRRDDSGGTPSEFVYIRLRHPSAEHFKDILAAAKRPDFSYGDHIAVHKFVDDCRPYYRYVLQDALNASAQKGAAAAGVLKASLRGLAASNVNGSTDTVCGVSPSSSISALAAAAPTTSWNRSDNDFDATFMVQLSAAWALSGTEAPPPSVTQQSYSGVEYPERGTECAAMPIRALRQAIEAALIDGQRVWSLSEQQAAFGEPYGNGCFHDVTESITVLSGAAAKRP